MLGVVTERVERLVNSFRRDRRLPQKGPEPGGGGDTKLAVAGRGEHDVIRQASSSNPDAANSVRHRTSPPGTLLAEPRGAQREFRRCRARAACTAQPTIRPTSTRMAPSRTSVSGSTADMVDRRQGAPKGSHPLTSCVGEEPARSAWCEGLDGRAGLSGRSAASRPPASHATPAGPIGIRNPDVAPGMPSMR